MKLLLALSFFITILAVQADYLGGFPQQSGGAVLDVSQYPVSAGDWFNATGTTLFSVGSQTSASLSLRNLLVFTKTGAVPTGVVCTLRIVESCYTGSKATMNSDLANKSLRLAQSTTVATAPALTSNMNGWLNFTFATPYNWGAGVCADAAGTMFHINYANISCVDANKAPFRQVELRAARYLDSNTDLAGTYNITNGRMTSQNTQYRSVFSHCYAPDECSPNNNNCQKCKANPKCKYCSGGRCTSKNDYCQADEGCLRCGNSWAVVTKAGDSGTNPACCNPNNVLETSSGKYCCSGQVSCGPSWTWTGTQCCLASQTYTSNGRTACCATPVTLGVDGKRYCCTGVTNPTPTCGGAPGTNLPCCPAKNVLTVSGSKYCCPSDVSAGGWSWTGSQCCPTTQTITDKYGKTSCCAGQVTIGVDGKTKYCCDSTITRPGCTHGGAPNTNPNCCPARNILTFNGQKYCCPSDVSAGGWSWTGSQCCPASQTSTAPDGTKTCCPSNVYAPTWTAIGAPNTNKLCCPLKNTLSVPTGNTIVKYCCPSEVTSDWTWTGKDCCSPLNSFKGPDGTRSCCPTGQVTSSTDGKSKYCCVGVTTPTWTTGGDQGVNTNCCPRKNVVQVGSNYYCCASEVKTGDGWTGSQCCPSGQITTSPVDGKTKNCCPNAGAVWVSNNKCCPANNVLTVTTTSATGVASTASYCCVFDVKSKGGASNYGWTGSECCALTQISLGSNGDKVCCPASAQVSTSPDGKTKFCCPNSVSNPTWVSGKEESTSEKCCPPKNTLTYGGAKYCCVADVSTSEYHWTGSSCCPKNQVSTSPDGKYKTCCPSTVVNPTWTDSENKCCEGANVLTVGNNKYCCPTAVGDNWTWSGNQCCPPSRTFPSADGKSTICCPKDKISTSWGEGKSKCCIGTTNPVWTGQGEANTEPACCPITNVLTVGSNKYCCASAVSNGWIWTGTQCCADSATQGPSGQLACCTGVSSPVYTTNEPCCPFANTLLVNGVKYCCPTDVSAGGYGWASSKCCPTGNIFNDVDGKPTVCCPPEQITEQPPTEECAPPTKYCCIDVADPVFVPSENAEDRTNPKCCPLKNVLKVGDDKYCCYLPVQGQDYEWTGTQCCKASQTFGEVCCQPDRISTSDSTPPVTTCCDISDPIFTPQTPCCPVNRFLSENNKKYCCPTPVQGQDYKWTGTDSKPECCPAQQTTTNPDDASERFCCADVPTPVWTNDGDSGAVKKCCPREFVTTLENGKTYCCSGDASSPAFTKNNKCCPANQVLPIGNNEQFCCPTPVNPSTWGYTGSVCCPKDQITTSPSDSTAKNCCPSGVASPVWTNDGAASVDNKCCPTAQRTTDPSTTTNPTTYCCPASATRPVWTSNGDTGAVLKCCPELNVLTISGVSYCCASEVNGGNGWSWTGTTCCPTAQTVGQTCCPLSQLTTDAQGQKSCCTAVTNPKPTTDGEPGTQIKCCPATNVLNGIHCCINNVSDGTYTWTTGADPSENKCCPSKQTVKTAAGGYICCPTQVTSSPDKAFQACCPADVESPTWTNDKEPTAGDKACCPLSNVLAVSSGSTTTKYCCEDPVVTGTTWTGSPDYCCPPQRSFTDTKYPYGPICCPTSQITEGIKSGNTVRTCCPANVKDPEFTSAGENKANLVCCPATNVLNDKYCCISAVNDNDYTWTDGNTCCPNTQVTTSPVDGTTKRCCPNVDTPKWLTAGEKGVKDLKCCPTTNILNNLYCCAGSVSTGTWTWIPTTGSTTEGVCCPSAQVIKGTNGAADYCCPASATIDQGGKRYCCPQNNKPVVIPDANGVGQCCDGADANKDGSYCCAAYDQPAGSNEWDPVKDTQSTTYDNLKCCPVTYVVTLGGNLYCCPGTTTGSNAQYGPTKASESKNPDYNTCCPSNKILTEFGGVDKYCCDKSWTGTTAPTLNDARWISNACCPASGAVVDGYGHVNDKAEKVCCDVLFPDSNVNSWTNTKNVLCCPSTNATQIYLQSTSTTCNCHEIFPYCCPFNIDPALTYYLANKSSDPRNDLKNSQICCPPERLTLNNWYCCPASIKIYPGATTWVPTGRQFGNDPNVDALCCPNTHKAVCAPNAVQIEDYCCPQANMWYGLRLSSYIPLDPVTNTADYTFCCPDNHVLGVNGKGSGVSTYCCADPVTIDSKWDTTNKRCTTDTAPTTN